MYACSRQGYMLEAPFNIFLHASVWTCVDPEGGTGGPDPPPPLKNYKNIGFLCISGPDPVENNEATDSAFNIEPSSARQRNTKMVFP